jgi:hypothetical protein
MTDGPRHKSSYVHTDDGYIATVDGVDIYRTANGGASCLLVWGPTYGDFYCVVKLRQLDRPSGDLTKVPASTRDQIVAVCTLMGLMP